MTDIIKLSDYQKVDPYEKALRTLTQLGTELEEKTEQLRKMLDKMEKDSE